MKKSIVYISPYFWPEQIGSAPYCSDVSSWLSERGHTVRVIAFRPHYPNAEQFAAWHDGSRDRENYNGAEVFRVRAKGRGAGGLKERLANDLVFLGRVLRFAFQAGFAKGDVAKTDVIVAYVPSCLSLFGAAFLSRLTGARVVGVVHDIETGLAASLGMVRTGALFRFMRLVERLAFNCASDVIVLTQGMAAELRKNGCRGRISILPIWSPVFPERDQPATATPTICYSGNFGKKQNLDQILPLIRMLDERRPEVRVVLRGEGSEKQRIAKLISEMGVRNTSFLSLVPADQLCDSLQSVDVHLVPQAMNVSNYALPSKIVNIMAAGRPFVCVAERGSSLDLLARDSGAGVCAYPNDDETLYDAVNRLIDDRKLMGEMGRRGRRYVIANMDRNQILSRYEDLIADGSTQYKPTDPYPSLSPKATS